MAAGEEQAEPVVGHRLVVAGLARLLGCLDGSYERRQFAPQRDVAAEPVEGAVAAVAVSQAPGRSGTPDRPQACRASTYASCAHPSARSRSPATRTVAASTKAHS